MLKCELGDMTECRYDMQSVKNAVEPVMGKSDPEMCIQHMVRNHSCLGWPGLQKAEEKHPLIQYSFSLWAGGQVAELGLDEEAVLEITRTLVFKCLMLFSRYCQPEKQKVKILVYEHRKRRCVQR